MKTFIVYFAKYPFNMATVQPKSERLKALTLEDAIQQVSDKYGDTIEIFKSISKELK